MKIDSLILTRDDGGGVSVSVQGHEVIADIVVTIGVTNIPINDNRVGYIDGLIGEVGDILDALLLKEAYKDKGEK